MKQYLDTTNELGKQFYQNFHDKGEIVMLNLLKFKTVADYSNFDLIKPETEITGKEAYQLYIDKTLPELKKAESQVIFYGDSKNFLIGPEYESWDAVLLVKHKSVAKFMQFAENKAYLKNVGHRTAALQDSRLLPIAENKL